MAGRILPVALATVSGIAIGMATFGEELKSQRMKRLTEEYNRDVAAAAAANNKNPASIAPATSTATPPPTSIPPVKEETQPATTSWSDALGFWAWKKSPQKDPVPAALAAPAVAQEAPVRSKTEEQIKKP
ncbi:uncharacterized protein EKO05_0006222 [Ascochyta rabiei]|uniref:Uncharacterized protein n=1 Tax=Didymella rabiei TaxID=5454 RepID=A0A163AZ16_DIDRA|nr:uncharacterized protein EKO05_0006222 [Ascochyta rabiei]KZM21478.1 hypothetical protein ST47_g7404 [Ascochyta rabiei]UPX15783.1 hypothetical protein EKO05_0006222 [Ascochyta rabiei]